MKKGKAVQAWKDYTYDRGISEKRMAEIVIEFGEFEIKTSAIYKPGEITHIIEVSQRKE